jgi:anti-sigma factor RsiW
MSRIPRLSAEQRADLVAYLDGELPEDQAREIETVLSASQVARHEVEMLDRTWDLLEVLPRESASAEFASKTLATIKVETTRTPPDWQPYVRRCLIALGWATWLSAAVVTGFAVGNRWVPREDDALVHDLPLLQNLDAYRDTGSVEFLNALHDRRLLLDREVAP